MAPPFPHSPSKSSLTGTCVDLRTLPALFFYSGVECMGCLVTWIPHISKGLLKMELLFCPSDGSYDHLPHQCDGLTNSVEECFLKQRQQYGDAMLGEVWMTSLSLKHTHYNCFVDADSLSVADNIGTVTLKYGEAKFIELPIWSSIWLTNQCLATSSSPTCIHHLTESTYARRVSLCHLLPCSNTLQGRQGHFHSLLFRPFFSPIRWYHYQPALLLSNNRYYASRISCAQSLFSLFIRLIPMPPLMKSPWLISCGALSETQKFSRKSIYLIGYLISQLNLNKHRVIWLVGIFFVCFVMINYILAMT